MTLDWYRGKLPQDSERRYLMQERRIAVKQTDPIQIERAWEQLDEMHRIRGSALPEFYFQLANDPQLLAAFKNVYVACNRGEQVIPKKYRELMIMILGCARGVETTITVHGNLAIKEGASIEEVGEALRIALMICGVSAVLPAAALFDKLEKADRSEAKSENLE